MKTHVVATAVDWGRGGDNTAAGSTGADIDYGAGRLDGYAALKAAGAPLAAPPATPKHELREGTLAATGATVDYKLSVADVQFPLAATLIHSGVAAASATTPDFDLYLYGPSGSLVAASETINRQETVTYKATATGTYTLRVYSYSGAGGYFVDVSAGLGGDTVAPTVASVSPVDGATGVAATTKVSATFSEAMDAAATQAGFSLVRASDGAAISGSYSWSGSTLTFTPSAALASGTAYRAKVAASAKDLAGNALGTDKVWSFTVATASTAVAVYPSSTAIYYGTLRSGAAARLGAADSLFYEVNSTTSGTRLVDWYARGVTVPNTLKSLKVTYRGKSSATCEQRLGVYNWTTGAWVWLNTRSAGTSLVDTTVSVGGTLADYVSGTSGDGDVAVRIRCSRTDAVSFFGSGDLLQLEFTR